MRKKDRDAHLEMSEEKQVVSPRFSRCSSYMYAHLAHLDKGTLCLTILR
jgi:hypothetical protein